VAGQSLLPFHYHDKGTLDVIGRNSAVAYIWGRSFRGFPAWLIWVGVHIFNLIGFRNRLLLLIDWAWAYLFSEHGVRLIVPFRVSSENELTTMEISNNMNALAGGDTLKRTSNEGNYTYKQK
jgi:hypothetical protein